MKSRIPASWLIGVAVSLLIKEDTQNGFAMNVIKPWTFVIAISAHRV